MGERILLLDFLTSAKESFRGIAQFPANDTEEMKAMQRIAPWMDLMLSNRRSAGEASEEELRELADKAYTENWYSPYRTTLCAMHTSLKIRDNIVLLLSEKWAREPEILDLLYDLRDGIGSVLASFYLAESAIMNNPEAVEQFGCRKKSNLEPVKPFDGYESQINLDYYSLLVASKLHKDPTGKTLLDGIPDWGSFNPSSKGIHTEGYFNAGVKFAKEYMGIMLGI